MLLTKTEVNGPANIIMILDYLLELKLIDMDAYKAVKPQAEKTIKYIQLLDNPNNVRWSDVK